jgi:hypothetical protein
MPLNWISLQSSLSGLCALPLYSCKPEDTKRGFAASSRRRGCSCKSEEQCWRSDCGSLGCDLSEEHALSVSPNRRYLPTPLRSVTSQKTRDIQRRCVEQDTSHYPNGRPLHVQFHKSVKRRRQNNCHIQTFTYSHNAFYLQKQNRIRLIVICVLTFLRQKVTACQSKCTKI